MMYGSEKGCHDRILDSNQKATCSTIFNQDRLGTIFLSCMVGLKLLGKLGDSASVRDGTPRLQIAAPGSLKLRLPLT